VSIAVPGPPVTVHAFVPGESRQITRQLGRGELLDFVSVATDPLSMITVLINDGGVRIHNLLSDSGAGFNQERFDAPDV